MSKEALEKSIKHWEEIRQIVENGLGTRVSLHTSSTDCALCTEYEDKLCEGCPVSVKTGKDGCVGTPYSDVTNTYANNSGVATEKLLNHVNAMVVFLKSLRNPQNNCDSCCYVRRGTCVLLNSLRDLTGERKCYEARVDQRTEAIVDAFNEYVEENGEVLSEWGTQKIAKELSFTITAKFLDRLRSIP